MLKAGELDRLVDIERKTVTADEFGGEVEIWDKIAHRHPAAVRPLRGEERFVARQFVAKQHVEFTLRWSAALADLNPLDRIVYPMFSSNTSPLPDPPDHQWYDIVEVSELGRRAGIKVLATRRSEIVAHVSEPEPPNGDSPPAEDSPPNGDSPPAEDSPPNGDSPPGDSPPGIAIDVFVDSVNGDDGNDGLTAETALQSLDAFVSALSGIGSGAKGQLAGDSIWRESLDASGITNVDLRWDGEGSPPIITGFDVVEGTWTQDETFTNLWYVDITHNSAGSHRPVVLDDGELMYRRTTASLANDNEGNYYSADAGSANPLRVYINPGEDPNSNGHEYEITTRDKAIIVGLGGNVYGLVARGAMSNNGPLEAGIGSTVRRCVSAFGTKHNMLVGSGLVEDCVLYDNDAPSASEGSSTTFVGFSPDATGLSLTLRRCLINIKHPATSLIFNHTSNDPVTQHANVTVDQCVGLISVNGSGTGIEGGAENYTVTKSCLYGQMNALVSVFADVLSGTHLIGRNVADHATVRNAAGDSAWEKCALFRDFNDGSNAIIRADGSFDMAIDHVTLHSSPNYFGSAINWASPAAGGGIALNQSIVVGNNVLNIPTGSDYVDGDGNTYISANIGPFGSYHGDARNLATDMATWRSDTGQDANSIGLTALPFTGNPIDGDFRVDGTVLAGSGCNEHWDYNLREIVAGPPERWPATPTSFDEAVDYISDPAAWDFYPIQFTMAAGEIVSPFTVQGYLAAGIVNGQMGSINAEPIEGHPLRMLVSGDASIIEFDGDCVSLLTGKTVWVDGIEYATGFNSWAVSMGHTQASWVSNAPVFDDEEEYFVEIK